MSEPPRSPSQSGAAPRFDGSARARQSLRLVAALGMLAGCAIATGLLASLAVSPSSDDDEQVGAPLRPWTIEPVERLAPERLVEQRVLEAERAATRALAAVREAAELGVINAETAAQLERRLEHLGESPFDALRRDLSGAASPTDETQRRPHLRTIASVPVEL